MKNRQLRRYTTQNATLDRVASFFLVKRRILSHAGDIFIVVGGGVVCFIGFISQFAAKQLVRSDSPEKYFGSANTKFALGQIRYYLSIVFITFRLNFYPYFNEELR